MPDLRPPRCRGCVAGVESVDAVVLSGDDHQIGGRSAICGPRAESLIICGLVAVQTLGPLTSKTLPNGAPELPIRDCRDFIRDFAAISLIPIDRPRGVPVVEDDTQKGKFAFAATLRECKSRYSARLLEEAFLNGIAPAKTAAHFEPELSRANRERKRR